MPPPTTQLFLLPPEVHQSVFFPPPCFPFVLRRDWIVPQTKLCHTLALAAAEAETGLSRPSIDRAFIPILLELMSDPGSRRGPDVPLQACRALNYFLQIGAAGDVGVQRGMRTYALCITCAATAGTAEYQVPT